MTSIKLVCVNIERNNHLGRVMRFLDLRRPDVLCLQEVSEPDIGLFEKLMGHKLTFAPMTRHRASGTIVGVGLVATAPLLDIAVHYYRGTPDQVPAYQNTGELGTPTERPNTSSINYALVCGTMAEMRIATTHLTWTLNGESTPEQLTDAEKMLAFAQAEADTHGGLLLCGDFNAPRGKETFGRIAARFADAIPPKYETSLDLNLHRAGQSPAAERMSKFVVDGLFHTPNYRVNDVALHAGVSDHMAITAKLSRD